MKLHPDCECTAVTQIDVEVARPGPLVLRYRLHGSIARLRLPPPAGPVRADNLWRHTCCEAFVRAPTEAGYHEFNFSPSMQWAAYRFTGYREPASAPCAVPAPRIETEAGPQTFTLQATLDLDVLADSPSRGAWQIGLACVIEETNGRLSYWALAHPEGKPDFHHAIGFAHELPRPHP